MENNQFEPAAFQRAGAPETEPTRWFLGPMVDVIGVLQAQSDWTWKHSGRVARYALAFGRHLGLDLHALMVLQCASILHDVGKVIVPREVLDKASMLSRDEWYTITKHPMASSRMLKSQSLPVEAVVAAQSHHEWYDGTGYPMGLVGEAIPLAARILSLADAYDAMSSDRPYRPALSPDAILAELEKGAGAQFDPHLVARLRPLLSGNLNANHGARRMRVLSDDLLLFSHLWFAAYPWGWELEAWPEGWGEACPEELLAEHRPEAETQQLELTVIDARCVRRLPAGALEAIPGPVLWIDPVKGEGPAVYRPLDLESMLPFVNPDGEGAVACEHKSSAVRVLIADPYQLFREALRRFLDQLPDVHVVAEANSPSSYRRARATLKYDVAIVASDLLVGTRSTCPLRADDWLIDDNSSQANEYFHRSVVLVTDEDMTPEMEERIWTPGSPSDGQLYIYRGAPAELMAEAIVELARAN